MRVFKTFIRIVLVGVLSYSTYCVLFITGFCFLGQDRRYPLGFWDFLFPFLTSCVSMVYIIVRLVKEMILSLQDEESTQ